MAQVMSVQFGRYNFDGRPIDRNDLDQVRPVLAPYGPDSEHRLCKDTVGILYFSFHTTKESRREVQPHTSPSGTVITWDGRLDNREDLIRRLNGGLTAGATDLAIVTAAYEQWGTASFACLVGDWALSILDPKDRSLILAKDFLGARHLYYSVCEDHVSWCTILDPLVLSGRGTFALCEEYVAGWFSSFPDTHLTPYAGIWSVPPSSFVVFRTGKQTVRIYWEFDPGKRTHYKADEQYEEHFRTAFAEAVKRTLRSDSAILAELSGGIDSSSIVCMADTVIAQGGAGIPQLDTVSYYNDSEPNWDERPYFTIVEKRRGRQGCHIRVPSAECSNLEFKGDRLYPTPGSPCPNEVTDRFADCLNFHGNRVVLSGIGGDEVTGGVPTPSPELADLLVSGHLQRLVLQLTAWALYERRPWVRLLLEACRGFFPPVVVGIRKQLRPAPWLNRSFVKRHKAALTGYEPRLKLFGPPPSFQENLRTLRGLQRQFGCSVLTSEPLCEKRYPFLDRDLLEFLYSVPADQLVRPGQRRSLLRRALAGLVPDELLNRRRKAFAARSPMVSIATEWARLDAVAHDMKSASFGIVDGERFSDVLRMVRGGQQVPIVTVMRTLAVEFWLRHVSERALILDTPPRNNAHFPRRDRREALAEEIL